MVKDIKNNIWNRYIKYENNYIQTGFDKGIGIWQSVSLLEQKQIGVLCRFYDPRGLEMAQVMNKQVKF